MVDLAQASEGGLETSILSDVLLPLALAIIMLGMGMGLRWAHFKELAKAPRGLLAGLLGQLILLPVAGGLVATLFIVVFDLETELALGLLLLAAAPGGATSNMLTFLSRGHVALSVSLTAITSIGSFLLTPAAFFATTYALYGDASLIQVSFLDILTLTLAVVAGPVVIGMVIGHFFPSASDKVDRPLRIFSIVLLFVLIAGIIMQNREGFWDFARDTIPAAAALNVLALLAGFTMARLFRLPQDQGRSVMIEVGFQNGTFAILLAITQLDSSRAALMPGFYSLFMFASGGLLATIWGRSQSSRAASSASTADS